MKARFLLLLPTLLASACQTSNPFFTKGVEEPDWFKARQGEAAAKDYPATAAVPPKPHDLPPLAVRKAEQKAVEQAGAQVLADTRSRLGQPDPAKTAAFTRKAHADNVPPPLVEDVERPQ